MAAIKHPAADMQAVRAGDNAAFVVAVAAYANKLFAAACSHIAFRATALDAVKDDDTARA